MDLPLVPVAVVDSRREPCIYVRERERIQAGYGGPFSGLEPCAGNTMPSAGGAKVSKEAILSLFI